MQKTIYAEEYRVLLEWLRNQRRQKGLTMRNLATRLHVHHSWVGRIEQGDRRLDIMEFVQLCDTIGCDPHEGLQLVRAPSDAEDLRKVAEARSIYRTRRPAK